MSSSSEESYEIFYQEMQSDSFEEEDDIEDEGPSEFLLQAMRDLGGMKMNKGRKKREINTVVQKMEREITHDIRFVTLKKNRGESDEIFAMRKGIYCFLYDTSDYKSRAMSLAKAMVNKYEHDADYSEQVEEMIRNIVMYDNFQQHLKDLFSPILSLESN